MPGAHGGLIVKESLLDVISPKDPITAGCLGPPQAWECTMLVSVIIPAYNVAEHLRECIDSVLAQDVPVEVIVVDDGSTDGTPSILKEYGDRIVAIRQANAGAAVARNVGLDRATGEYIAFLDGDDAWLPGKLRRQIELFDGDTGLVYSGWYCLYPDGSVTKVKPLPGPTYADLLLNCHLLTTTVVMKRETAQQVGRFDPDLKRGQDYDYWIRASQVTKIKAVETPLAIYRVDGAAQVKKSRAINWESIVIRRAVEKFGSLGLSEAQVRDRLWGLGAGFGYTHFHQGNYPTAIRAFVDALKYRPTHAQTWLYLLASLMRGRRIVSALRAVDVHARQHS